MKRLIWALILGQVWLTAICAHAAESSSGAQHMPLVQMNIAGAGFAPQVIPGQAGTNYFFPEPGYLDQWKAKGIRVIRFSILWERLQPVLEGEFDPGYAGRVDALLKQAADRDIGVIIDIHNYGLYRDRLIGSPAVPLASYRNLLERVAERWHASRGLQGYDLMNEPHDGADAYWPEVAQAGIDAVRKHDPARPIYVEGRGWSSAANWPKVNAPLLLLKDPANRLIFSAHLYLDQNGSGTYKAPPGADFDLDTGVARARPFVEWLEQHHRQGQVGEFGAPANDPRWLQAMDRLLAYLSVHCVPMAYWAAGPMWGDNALSIEPQQGKDKPQWSVLVRYMNGNTVCP
jgi:endoglucanase